MRARPNKEHSEILARRLEQLSAELHETQPSTGVAPTPYNLTPYDLPPGEVEEEHTRIRPVRGYAVDATPVDQVPDLPQIGRHAARRRRGWIDLEAVSGRVGLEAGHVAIAAVLTAIALAVTCWWVLRDDAGEPLAAPGPGTALVTPVAEPTAVSTSAGATEVVVDVTGKVKRPGIVVLEPGSRVVDALDAAGGAKRGADLTNLNLARILTDGEQIVVGMPAAPGVASSSAANPSTSATGALVNLNVAGLAELDALPGVGPVTAQAIIDWRDANGGFQSVDQLLDVKGIGEVTLAELAPLVTL